jgi:hypothetical protein
LSNYIQTAGETYFQEGSLSQNSINIQGGSLSGRGTITGQVNISSEASVHPGNTPATHAPGTLTINGTFSSSGTLLIDIAGLEDGKFSVLKINGDAIFSGGNIAFDFINGFKASPGNYWDFLYADSIAGWDTLSFTFNGLSSGLLGKIEPIPNGERLLIAPVIPTMQEILLFFDTMVANGTLKGDGPGKSADNRLKALRNMLQAAANLIAAGNMEAAYQQLYDAYRKADGDPHIPDFIAGTSEVELAQMILALENSLMPLSNNSQEFYSSLALENNFQPYSASPAPIPSIILLLGAGLSGLIFYRHKKIHI